MWYGHHSHLKILVWLTSSTKKTSNKKNFLYVYLIITKVEQCIPNGNISKKMIKMFKDILEMNNLAEGITQVQLKHICNL